MILGDIARLRQGVHRLAVEGFSPPTTDRLDGVATGLVALEEMGLDDFAFATPWFGVGRVIDEVSVDELGIGYVRLFEAGVRGSACPPVEGAYGVDARVGDVAALQAQLRSLYLEIGSRPSGFAATPDHASEEFGAMATLCAYEAAGHETGDVEASNWSLRRQGVLVSEHLGRWVPQFNACVQAVDGIPLFFAALARAAHAFVVHELDWVTLAWESRPDR